jgi:FAD-dependent urate hydroxylase
LIVGGGIAGLSLAIALEPWATDIEVIERSPEWSSEGAAITLRPPAVRAMRRLEVLDEVRGAGRMVDRQCFFTHSGDVLFELSLAPEGEPSVVVHRRRLQQILSEALGHTVVRMDDAPVKVEAHGPVVEVLLASGERRECDLVIGADGVYSWLRRELFPDAVVRPVGQQYWRFCVEGELVEHWSAVSDGNRLAALLPLPGMTYCAAQLSGSALLNGEAVGSAASLQQTFGDFPSPVSDVLGRVSSATEIHFGAVNEVVLEQWSSGPVGLIGDAAHALSPILTLGGGFAMEDAVVLADELQRQPPSAALAAFTNRRQPRVGLARRLANERIAKIADGATIDEARYQQEMFHLMRDDP